MGSTHLHYLIPVYGFCGKQRITLGYKCEKSFTTPLWSLCVKYTMTAAYSLRLLLSCHQTGKYYYSEDVVNVQAFYRCVCLTPLLTHHTECVCYKHFNNLLSLLQYMGNDKLFSFTGNKRQVGARCWSCLWALQWPGSHMQLFHTKLS